MYKTKFRKISFTLNYLITRKHMFKQRTLAFKKKPYHFRLGTIGFFNLKPQRFELVYLRGFKKILRRKHLKAKMRFKRRKFWFFLKPNCILSAKSVNSRMGAGVGSLIRVAIKLRPYTTFAEFREFSYLWLMKIPAYTQYRYPLKYIVVKKQPNIDKLYNCSR